MNKKHTSYQIRGIKVPGVTTVLSVIHKPGVVSWQRRHGFYKADRLLKEAGEFGTAVHTAIENYINGQPLESVNPKVQLALKGFAEWSEANIKRWLCQEQAVWNDEFMYAGTLDGIAELFSGEIVVVDYKTSTSLHASYDLQVTAYMRANRIENELPEFDSIETAIILHLDKSTGKWGARIADTSESTWDLFQCALKLYKWSQLND